MNKKICIIALSAATLFAACERYDHQIQDLNDRIEVLEGESIAPIEEQIRNINASIIDLKNVDSSLDGYIKDLEAAAADLEEELGATNTRIDNVRKELEEAASEAKKDLLKQLEDTKTAIEAELADIRKEIKALKDKDAELEKKIADLQKYVDEELTGLEGDLKTWAEGTFATLKQYESMQAQLSDLAALVEKYKTDITEAYTKAIEEAIATSETSMKAWVNEVLADGYYDIAAIDALLSAIEKKAADADAELAKQVKDQQDALEKAKADITDAYSKAIADAIETNNGIIDENIAAAVAAAQKNLQDQIDSIVLRIDDLEDMIKDLEERFASRIQSLAFVPQYTDGKVKMDYSTRTAELFFRISPASIAELIELEHVTAFVRYTDDPVTRAVNAEFPVVVSSVAGDETGIIVVSIEEDEDELFSDVFWKGDVESVVYIRINDGNSDVVSESVPMIAHNYVGTSNGVNGFEDDADESGEVDE